MPTPLVRILLVDDDDIVREALEIRLSKAEGLSIVGSVATGEDALFAANRLKPDLIILDLCLSGALSGVETMRSIARSVPRVRFIVLSANHLPEQVKQALSSGAAAYVSKLSAGIDLLEAIQSVIAGRHYASAAA